MFKILQSAHSPIKKTVRNKLERHLLTEFYAAGLPFLWIAAIVDSLVGN